MIGVTFATKTFKIRTVALLIPFNNCTPSVRRCPVVVPPENALPSKCGGTPRNLATFGSVCSFYCPHGFNPRGHDAVVCQADGTWSEASFACEGRRNTCFKFARFTESVGSKVDTKVFKKAFCSHFLRNEIQRHTGSSYID